MREDSPKYDMGLFFGDLTSKWVRSQTNLTKVRLHTPQLSMVLYWTQAHSIYLILLRLDYILPNNTPQLSRALYWTQAHSIYLGKYIHTYPTTHHNSVWHYIELSTDFKRRMAIFIVILTDYSNGFNSHLVHSMWSFGVFWTLLTVTLLAWSFGSFLTPNRKTISCICIVFVEFWSFLNPTNCNTTIVEFWKFFEP
jgi:hypothetical protein